MVVSLQQLAITFGIFLAGALNVGLQHWDQGWRISYGGKAFFSIILFAAMFLMPESPRWLVSQGRVDEARQSLRVIRFEEEIESELDMISQAVEEERAAEEEASKVGWLDLLSAKDMMWYRTMVGFFVQLLQQFSGINAASFYSTGRGG